MKQNLTAFLSAASMIATVGRAQCPYDLSDVTPAVEAFLAQNPQIPGINVRLQRGGVVLYERSFGAYTLDTQVPIASASKWMAGAVIMSLVDSGAISLDEPIGGLVPEFAPGLLGQITFRQCFSHTSGLKANQGPGLDDCSPCLNDRTTTLRNCATEIAAGGLRTGATGQPIVPGTDFAYGGCSMQAAGAAAEAATGAPWTFLFQQRVRGPLGLSVTAYGPGQNPRVAGGISSNLREYARFVQMIADGGTYQGTRVLSAASVSIMLEDQTAGVPVTYAPPVAAGFAGYGVGCWVNILGPNGGARQDSSEGAFGFSPWIDRTRRGIGVFLVREENLNVRPLVEFIQTRLRLAIDTSPDVSGNGVVDFSDITLVLNNFNSPSFPGAPQGPGPIGDASRNGTVDFADVTAVLASFGSACP